MIGVDDSQLSAWKRGKANPCGSSRQMMAMLCWLRCGGPRSVEEIVHLSHAMKTGKFEKMIRSYLDREAKLIAKRAAKKTLESVTTVQQQSD